MCCAEFCREGFADMEQICDVNKATLTGEKIHAVQLIQPKKGVEAVA
jgi:hypothetical protein